MVHAFWRNFTTITTAVLTMAGCFRAPTPSPEEIRLPPAFSLQLTATELDLIDFVAAGAIADPSFKADRLNSSRYKKGNIIISCEGDCPPSLIINSDTTNASWQTTQEDAGVYHFFLRASEGRASTKSSVTLTVKDFDRSPFLIGGNQEMTVNETDDVKIPLNVGDLDGDVVEITCPACPRDMSFVDGHLIWKPTFGQAGDHRFSLALRSRPASRKVNAEDVEQSAVIDRSLYMTTEGLIDIHVTKKDRPPTLKSGQREITLLEGTVGSLLFEGVDPDGDTVAFSTPATTPSFVTLSQDGRMLISPSFSDAGKITIDVIMSQFGKPVSTTTVMIHVVNVNRPPVYTGGVVLLSAKEGTISTFNLAKASDPDVSDQLVYSCVGGCLPGLTLTGDGQASYLPGFLDSGVRTFTMIAKDLEFQVSIPVKITVEETNRAPYFNPVVIKMDVSALFRVRYTFTATDDDQEDIGRLQFTCDSCPVGMTLNSLTGGMSWIPTPDQVGANTVQISVSDRRAFNPLSQSMSFPVQVNLVDRSPRFTISNSFIGIELTPVSTTSPSGVILPLKISAIDDDGDPVTFRCLQTSGPKDASPVAGCPVGMDFNSTTGVIRWTPSIGQKGIYDVIFTAISQPAWSSDPLDAKTTTLNFKFIIRKFNHAPIIDSPTVTSFETNEMGHQTADYRSAKEGPGMATTLSATDLDSDPLAFGCSNCPPSMVIDPNSGFVSWLPGYDQAKPNDEPYTGILFFVTDGDIDPATNRSTRVFFPPMTVIVHNVNRPPTAKISPAETVSVFEAGHQSASFLSPLGVPLSVGVEATDPDNDALVYTCVSGCEPDMVLNSLTGRLTWVPSYDFVTRLNTSKNTEPVILRAQDVGGLFFDFTAFTVTVLNVNRPPIVTLSKTSLIGYEGGHDGLGKFTDGVWVDTATDKPTTVSVSASDPDGDQVEYRCVTNCPVGLTINSQNGDVFFRPDYCSADDKPECENSILGGPRNGALKNSPSLSNIQFGVSDGKDVQLSKPMTIQLRNYDRPPAIILGGRTETVLEGGAFQTIISTKDPDGDLVKISCGAGVISPIYPTKGMTGCFKTTTNSYGQADAVKYYWPSSGLDAPPFGQVIGLLSIVSPSFACVNPDEVTLTSASSQITCLLTGGVWKNMTNSTIFNVSSLTSVSANASTVCRASSTTPRVGYCDAPTSGEPYILNLAAVSNSTIDVGTSKNLLFSKSTYIQNVDRHTLGSESSSQSRATEIVTDNIPEVGGFNTATNREQSGELLLTNTQWPFSGLSFFDIDSANACPGGSCPATPWPGTFRDGVYTYCDETSLEGCPLGIEMKQFCDVTASGGATVLISGTCEYGNPLNPTTNQPGCSGNFGPTETVINHPDVKLSDLLWSRCADKGLIKFNRVSRGSAKINNEPYRIHFKQVTSVHPGDFSQALYQPETLERTLVLHLTNADRPPVFVKIPYCDPRKPEITDCQTNVKEPSKAACGPGETLSCVPSLQTAPSAGISVPILNEGVSGTFLPTIEPGNLPGYLGINPGQVFVREPAAHYLESYSIVDGTVPWAVKPVGSRDIKTFTLQAFDRDNTPEVLPSGSSSTDESATYKLLGCRTTLAPSDLTSPDIAPSPKNSSPRWLWAYLGKDGLSMAPYFLNTNQSWFFNCPKWISLDQTTGVVAISPTDYDLSMSQSTESGRVCYLNTPYPIGSSYPYTTTRNLDGLCPPGSVDGRTVPDFYAVFAADACPKSEVDGHTNTNWQASCAHAGRSDSLSQIAIKIDVRDSDRKPSEVKFQILSTEQVDTSAVGVDIASVKPASMNEYNRPFRSGRAASPNYITDVRFSEDRKSQQFWGIPSTKDSYESPSEPNSLFRQYNMFGEGQTSEFIVSPGSWVDVRETDSYVVMMESSDPDKDMVYFDLEKTDETDDVVKYVPLAEFLVGGVVYKTGCDFEYHCRQLLRVSTIDRDGASDRYMSTAHGSTSMPTPAKVFGLSVRACSAGSDVHPGNKSFTASGNFGQLVEADDVRICSESRNPGYDAEARPIQGYPDVEITHGVKLTGQRWDGRVILSTRFHDVDRLPKLSVTPESTAVINLKEQSNSHDMCTRMETGLSYDVNGADEIYPFDNGVAVQAAQTVFTYTESDLADAVGHDPITGLPTPKPPIVADIKLQNGEGLATAHIESYDPSALVIEIEGAVRYSHRNRLRINDTTAAEQTTNVEGSFFVDNWAATTAPEGSADHILSLDYQQRKLVSMVSTITYDSGYGAMTPAYTQSVKVDAQIAGSYVSPCFNWWITADYTTIRDPGSNFRYDRIKDYILGGDVKEQGSVRLTPSARENINANSFGIVTEIVEPGKSIESFIGGGNNLETVTSSSSSIPAPLRALSSHRWLQNHSDFVASGALNVHEVADGVTIIISNNVFEYGGVSNLTLPSVQGAPSDLTIAVEATAGFILKHINFKPMWNFNYNNPIIGTRFTLVESLSGNGNLDYNSNTNLFRPKSQTLSIKPILESVERDYYEAQALLAGTNQTAVSVNILDDYIKPHVYLEDNTPMWAPFTHCPQDKVKDSTSNCSPRGRYDAINSKTRGTNGSSSNQIPNFKSGARNPNLVSDRTDMWPQYTVVRRMHYRSDGVGSFAPPLDDSFVTGNSVSVLFPGESIGQSLVTNKIYSFIFRGTDETYIVPAVSNNLSKEYTNGREKGLLKGFATGSPSDPFSYPGATGDEGRYLMGYPSFADHGDLSNFQPDEMSAFCKFGGSARAVTSGGVPIGSTINSTPIVTTYVCDNTTPSANLTYLWWRPTERVFSTGGGGGCGSILGCILGQ